MLLAKRGFGLEHNDTLHEYETTKQFVPGMKRLVPENALRTMEPWVVDIPDFGSTVDFCDLSERERIITDINGTIEDMKDALTKWRRQLETKLYRDNDGVKYKKFRDQVVPQLTYLSCVPTK